MNRMLTGSRVVSLVAFLFLASAAVLRGEGHCMYPMHAGTKLYVVDVKTGKAKAIPQEASLRQMTGPIVFKGVMYTGDPDNLVALDVSTGKTLWISQPGLSGDLIPTEEALYCGGTLRALNPKTGNVEWKAETGTGCTNLVLTDDLVIAGKGTGNTLQAVRALDRKTGKVRWQVELPGEPFSLTRTGDLLFVGRTDEVHLLDLKTGRAVWKDRADWPARPEFPPIHERPLHFECAGKLLYRFKAPAEQLDPGHIEALDALTRKVVWQTPLPARIDWHASLRVLNDLLFLENKGEVYAFQADTGKLQWQMDGVDLPYVSDAAKVYVADRRGGVRAVDRKTGRLEWRFDSSPEKGGTHGYPTLALADGSLYVVVNEYIDPRWGRIEPAEKRPLPR
jgi:outer membrane protein assembly factor BamB